MEHSVEQYFSASLAASSMKTYSTRQKHYLEFCSSFSLSPLPLQEHTLCQYAAVLANKGFATSSIKVYLASVRQLQISNGGQNPKIVDMPHLKQVLKGIRITQAANQSSPTPMRHSITPEILRAIKAS